MSARGFSLIELLVATAIIGLIAVSSLGLVSQAEREAWRAEIEQDAFERRSFALMKLRAAVSRASSASFSSGTVILAGPEGRSAWCVQDGVPAIASSGSRCESGALRVEPRGPGLVVFWSGEHVERILVGGGAR